MDVWAFIGSIIIGVVILFVFYLLSAIFFKKSVYTLAAKTGERMFGTAGLRLSHRLRNDSSDKKLLLVN